MKTLLIAATLINPFITTLANTSGGTMLGEFQEGSQRER